MDNLENNNLASGKTVPEKIEVKTTQKTEQKSKLTLILMWIFGVLLILLIAFFVWDKLKTNKNTKNLISTRDSLYQACSMLKTGNEQLKERFNTANDNYDDLLKKYNTLLDSALYKANALNEKQKELTELHKMLRKQDSLVNQINKTVKDALLGFKNDELNVDVKNGKVYVTMRDKLLFKSGSAEVQAKGLDALKKLAKVLSKNKDIQVLVEGHTDNVPINTKQYSDNWDLSVARANSIVRILSNTLKIEPERLTAAGRGEYHPLATNATEDGKAKNRRTEIILTPNLDELYKILSQKKVAK